MIKISVTNTKIYNNYYLMFTKNLENLVWFLVNIIKNEEKNSYSTFVTVTHISSLMISTVHSTLSPAFTFNAWATLTGTEVLTELLLDAPLLIFVFCLNSNVMSSIFIFSYTYICYIDYIILTI